MGNRNDFRNDAGWTFVELIITLSILGMIVTLSYPAFAHLGERMERELFLDFLASDLQFARTEAISREEEVKVIFKSSQHQMIVQQKNTILRQTKIPNRYLITTNYPQDEMVFRKSGQVRGGTIQLLLNGQRVGEVRVQVASGTPEVVIEP
ncbi:GspH/FimT family pseudopilin [Hazenella coriacea]|uniref:Type II transport protein GspH n=1 Tax=Hazenella coriacea TaxID=1179467 RepID=A0A4R3LB13_9BACL|nr:GspH/FimT family pseudopilin [Hazenella coriacea]TCS94706.1 type II transport protein GspH [Hazenella coriacea]